MISRRLILFSLLMLASSSAGAAFAQVGEPRIALVIGNGSYTDAPLRNPVNDAQDMAAVLRQLGFRVTLHTNATKRQMQDAIQKVGQDLRDGGVGLFFYSGHGVQSRGRNFLIPVGTSVTGEADLEFEAVDANFAIVHMEDARNRVNIVILDACRNNPFARPFRDSTKGLAPIEASRGTYIAYATGPGRVAADGTGRNSPFTAALLESLRHPDSGIDAVFNRVRQSVAGQTRGDQIPWSSTSLIGDFRFSVAGPPSPPPLPTTSMPDTRQPDLTGTGDSGRVRLNPKDGQPYVWIPPGTFRMGCSPGDTGCEYYEKPAHDVQISRAFWLGQTEVTAEAFWRFSMQTKAAIPPEQKGGRFPVINVTWDEAAAYCRWAGGRLPTEAEWEYAARAGTTGPRYGELNSIGWYGGNTWQEAGQKRANTWGLYDMLGNASEWTEDWYGNYTAAAAIDPGGPTSGQYRAMRGGSWSEGAWFARASFRFWILPGGRSLAYGFRCSLEVVP